MKLEKETLYIPKRKSLNYWQTRKEAFKNAWKYSWLGRRDDWNTEYSARCVSGASWRFVFISDSRTVCDSLLAWHLECNAIHFISGWSVVECNWFLFYRYHWPFHIFLLARISWPNIPSGQTSSDIYGCFSYLHSHLRIYMREWLAWPMGNPWSIQYATRPNIDRNHNRWHRSFDVLQRSTQHFINTVWCINGSFEGLLCRTDYVQIVGKREIHKKKNLCQLKNRTLSIRRSNIIDF